MPNDTLKQIITDIDEGAFHARYLRLPILDRPDSCNLPPLLASTQSLPAVTFPDVVKDCSYNWIEELIPVEPFVPPFPCPVGFQFADHTIGIRPLPTLAAVENITVGVSRGTGENGGFDICSYELQLPDTFVVPCYPAGPLFENHAAITVRNGEEETTTEIKLNRDTTLPCKWTLDGAVTIDIPEIPCPDGLTFLASSWQIKSTCSSVPAETRPVTIAKTPGYDCIYSINMPDLTIPCYPDGPQVHGQSQIVITDRGDVTSTQSLGFPTTPPACCDFELAGDIAIEIPCQTGLTVPIKTFKIVSTGPSVQPDTNKQLKLTKSNSDMCHYDLDFPDLQIPCYPNGPTVFGSVIVNVGDGAAALAPQTFSITTDPAATCRFELGGEIDIPLPDFTLECDELDFHGGIRIRKTASSPWLTNTVGLTNEQCGAVLAGDIDLNLPPFVVDCSGLSFGGSISVRAYQNGVPGNAFPSTVTLTSTPCGANIAGEILLDIPAFNFPCSAGYTTLNTGPTVKVNGGAPISHTLRVSKVNDPLNAPNGNQCGFALTGTLDIPVAGGGGGGFTYLRNWRAGSPIANGTVVGIIGHEGGRCNYVAQRAIASNEPPPTNDNAAWASLGCENGKRYLPFKVIAAKPPPEVDQTRKDYVKVVFDSKLATSKRLRNIIGINVPFRLGPGQSVYVEAIWAPLNGVFIAAGIAAAEYWDEDFVFGAGIAEVPKVWPEPYKWLQPESMGAAAAPFGGLSKNYLIDEFRYWAVNSYPNLAGAYDAASLLAAYTAGTILANDPLFDAAIRESITALETLHSAAVGGQAKVNYPFKSYALIAQAKPVGDTASGDLTLTTPGGEEYAVQQILNAHLLESGLNINGKNILQLRAGGTPTPYGQIELQLPVALAGNTTVSFTVNVLPNTQLWTDAGEFVPQVGTGPNDIHIYYTAGQTPSLTEPSYDDFRNAEIIHHDPASPNPILTMPAMMSPAPTLSIRAIAYHPRMRCSSVVVKNYTAT